jgi:IS1 family transposase
MARQHVRETDEAGASVPEGEDGRQSVWVRLAPKFRWMIAAVVGPRTLDTAKAVVAITKALIAAFYVVTTCARTGTRGHPRQPVCEPHPDLVHAPLVKQQKQGKQLTRSARIVLGAERLTQRRLTISTAGVERVSLTLRQTLAPLVRQTSSFCKNRERMQQRVVFWQAFSHVARSPMSWRRPLPRRARHHHSAIRPR